MKKTNKKIYFIVALALIFVFSSVSVWADDAGYDWYDYRDQTGILYIVTAPDGYVNMRMGPGTEYAVRDKISNGEILQAQYMVDTKGNGSFNWLQILYEGEYGWVAMSQISVFKPDTLFDDGTKTDYEVEYSGKFSVNLKFGPDDAYETVNILINNGDIIHIIKEYDNYHNQKWGLVEDGEILGWINMSATKAVESFDREAEDKEDEDAKATMQAQIDESVEATMAAKGASQDEDSKKGKDEAEESEDSENASKASADSVLIIVLAATMAIVLIAIIILVIMIKKSGKVQTVIGYCNKCGSRLDSGVLFCTVCGNKVK